MHRILSVTTQGRYSRHNQWVTSYYVSYSQDGTRWETISTPFEGNDDQNTMKTNLLPDDIVARYIRLLPISWEGHISMRFDVTGCAVPGTMTLYTLVTIMSVLLKSGKIMGIGPNCVYRDNGATSNLPFVYSEHCFFCSFKHMRFTLTKAKSKLTFV